MAEGLVITEQRNLARRELIYYLKVTDCSTGRELGRMGDLNIGGMLVMGRPPLEPGTVYDAAVELPKVLQSPAQKEIHLKCEVIWNRPGPRNGNFEESGIKFINPDQHQKAMIDRLIDLFAMPGSDH